MAPERNRRPGAVSVGGRKKGAAWLKWLLPLLLLLLGAILFFALSGDDDDKKAAQTPTAAQTAPADQGSAESAAPAAGGGTLTAGEASLLPAPQDIGQYVGQEAEGREVVVQSVVENEGFFVGTSETDRVYVEYGGEVGEDERDFRPEVGDKVNLTGPVRPAPEDPGRTLRLEKADSDLIKQQGAFINATTAEKAE